VPASASEIEDDDVIDLPRIAFRFDRAAMPACASSSIGSTRTPRSELRRHHEVAARLGLDASGRLGAMLPDFAAMLGTHLQRDRCRPRW